MNSVVAAHVCSLFHKIWLFKMTVQDNIIILCMCNGWLPSCPLLYQEIKFACLSFSSDYKHEGEGFGVSHHPWLLLRPAEREAEIGKNYSRWGSQHSKSTYALPMQLASSCSLFPAFTVTHFDVVLTYQYRAKGESPPRIPCFSIETKNAFCEQQ